MEQASEDIEVKLEEGRAEEEAESEEDDPEPLFTVAPLLKRDDEAPEAATVLSIRLENCGLKGAALEALGEFALLRILRQSLITAPQQRTGSEPRDSSTSLSAAIASTLSAPSLSPS